MGLAMRWQFQNLTLAITRLLQGCRLSPWLPWLANRQLERFVAQVQFPRMPLWAGRLVCRPYLTGGRLLKSDSTNTKYASIQEHKCWKSWLIHSTLWKNLDIQKSFIAHGNLHQQVVRVPRNQAYQQSTLARAALSLQTQLLCTWTGRLFVDLVSPLCAASPHVFPRGFSQLPSTRVALPKKEDS